MPLPSLPLWTWVTLFMVMAIAVWTDLAQRRIPNRLLLSTAGVGALLALLPDGMGLAPALAGAFVAGVAYAPMYLMRWMGAGDLKLLTTAGLLVGMPRASALCLSVAMAGGLLAMVWLWYMRRPVTARSAAFKRMPYAVAIASGTAAHGLLAPLLALP